MIFTVDVEDWQQSVYDFNRPVSARVLYNTSRLLDLLDEYGVTGTFFVQGMVAEKYPNLVRAIHTAGHEVACHSYSHRRLYHLTPSQFAEEMRRAMGALQDACGAKILGYRAPTFAVTDAVVDWYATTLREHGIVYDSSIMPSSVRKCYGFSDSSIISRLRAYGLDVYPLSVTKILGKNLPVMGGGYFRIYPYWLTRWLARDLDASYSVFYMHPYEIDTCEYHELKRHLPIPWQMRWHQFGGRGSVEGKLRHLLRDYTWQSFRTAYYQPVPYRLDHRILPALDPSQIPAT